VTRPGELTIDERRDDGTVVLGLAGELDLATAGSVEAAVARARAGGLARLVLDLRELAFLDSTGIQEILRADLASREEHFELVIIRGPRAVERLFSLLELHERVTVVDDDPDARSA
jgi:anti-sigma B factor antagonist